MANNTRPVLQDILRGNQEFNQWQEAEEQRQLPRLSATESLNQFFELCDLVRAWRPGPELDQEWIAEKQAGWMELYRRQGRTEKD
jgi:hypothetical protein